jgi:hypothetical protein
MAAVVSIGWAWPKDCAKAVMHDLPQSVIDGCPHCCTLMRPSRKLTLPRCLLPMPQTIREAGHDVAKRKQWKKPRLSSVASHLIQKLNIIGLSCH